MSGPRIAAVVLAAGSSSRMEGGHKLLAELDGRAVVEIVVSLAMRSAADPVVVVLGHRADDVRARIPDVVGCVRNPAPSAGLSTSLATGVRALPDDVDGALILLGDMPLVRDTDIDALIGAFAPGRVCVPVVQERWANPVLWSREFFPRILDLEGDRGARGILEEDRDRIIEVPLDSPGLLFDIDTRDDLERARAER